MRALLDCSFYDELFRFICSTQLPKSVFQWFSERLSSHFEETFLVDFIPSEEPAVSRYIVQFLWPSVLFSWLHMCFGRLDYFCLAFATGYWCLTARWRRKTCLRWTGQYPLLCPPIVYWHETGTLDAFLCLSGYNSNRSLLAFFIVGRRPAYL